MSESSKLKQPEATVAIGAALIAVGVATSRNLSDHTVFGVPGSFITLALMSMSLLLVIVGAVRVHKARKAR